MRTDKLLGITGAALIVVGVGLVIYQTIFNPPPYGSLYEVDMGPTHWVLKTQYPGLTLACVGALLMIVGAMIGRRRSN
jgi:hypothetical protein